MQQPEHDHDAAAMDNKLAKTNSSDLSPARTLEDDGSLKLSEKSFGVIKSEAAAIWMSRNYVWLLFGFIALAAYCVSLDQYTSSTYELEALATSFGQHSLIATINTAQSIMQSVSQPPFAKLCDIVGRFESYIIAVVLYVVGYIIVATSQNIGVRWYLRYELKLTLCTDLHVANLSMIGSSSTRADAVGTIIYTLGITGFWLINQIPHVIIADNTSLFWSIFPSIPGTINIWVSGNIAQSVINGPLGWRFGFAMFTFLVPLCLTPVILGLAYAQRQARKLGYLDGVVAPWRNGHAKKASREVFWQVDVPGLLLMVAAYSLILIPLTIARTAARGWQSAFVPGMIVPGGVCLVAFFVWEARFARHPILPFPLLKNRTVLAAFSIALFSPMAGSIQANFLLTWYRVAAGQSILSATRLNGLTSFLGTLTAAVTGLLVVKVRYLKPFIVAGTLIVVLVLGLMTRFRGRENTVGELAALQVFKGIGQGLISFPTQAALQTACKHEHLALLTASWLAFFYLSQAIGSAIGGAIWGATLPPRLLAATGDQALANSIFKNPVSWIQANGFDNPVREAVAQAYSDGQRFILIAAVSVASLAVISALFLGNPRLGDTVTLSEVEGSDKVVNPAAGDQDGDVRFVEGGKLERIASKR